MTEDTQLRIVIEPKPSAREAAAIAAAVVAMQQQLPEDAPTKPANRWREAGKRESLRGEIRE